MSENIEKKGKTVDISAFFNRKNEEEGVWFEPEILGEPLGLRFKVIGSNSNAAAKATADYRREMDKVSAIKDEGEKNERTMEAIAKYTSALTRDIKPAEGVKAVNGGAEFSYTEEGCYQVMLNSSVIARAVLDFAYSDRNFMNKSRS